MNRRTVLAGAGISLSTSLSGCLQSGSSLGMGAGNDNTAGTDVTDRVKECERQYIQTQVVTRDDETIDDQLQPAVIATESRSDGDFIELSTEFGVTRETDGEPDAHLDYQVDVLYLVSGDELYRTDDTEGNPRDGTSVNC